MEISNAAGEYIKYFKNDNRFEFLNYDHYACDSTVIRANISNVPLEDNMINIAIICLSMWERNCADYIKEIYRILEDHDILLIIEAIKRWITDEGDNKLEKIFLENNFTIRNCNWNPHSNVEDEFLFIECVRS